MTFSHGDSSRSLSSTLFLTVLVVYTTIYLTSGVRDPGAADGHYSFLYARSIVFDGDLDFRNDYAVCGDPYRQGIDRGTGRVDNPAYAGPALVWIPLLAAARLVVPMPRDASAAVRAGCEGRLARAALAIAMPLGALAILLSFHAARRFAGPRAAFIAAALFAFASSLPLYASVFVSSSHVFECVFAAACVWSSLRAAEDGDWRASRWLIVGLLLFALTLQRLPDAGFALIPLAVTAASTHAPRRKVAAAAIVLAGPALGVVTVSGLYTYLYGSPWMLPQGRHFMHVAHARPFLLLFAPQGGLLYATPSAYLAGAGVALAVRDTRYRRFAFAALAVIAATLWIASSPLDWHAKATFGARRLVVLTPLFVVFAALALQALFDRLTAGARRPAVAAIAVVTAGLSVPVVGAVMATTRGKTPLIAAPVYMHEAGPAFRVLSGVGDVAVLPAKLFYTLRFGVPMRSFGFATTDLFYRRSYRDLTWEPNVLPFADGALASASRGTERRENGLALVAEDASVVFTAGWPFADMAVLDVSAAAPGLLAMSIATTFHRCDLGERIMQSGRQSFTFAVPEGCFDSGLVAIGFRSRPAVGTIIERLTLNDRRALPPPF